MLQKHKEPYHFVSAFLLFTTQNHLITRDKAPKKMIFLSDLESDCSLCVSQWCLYLATGFLTLQVQLPVLKPHLKRGITTYYSSTNKSLAALQPAGSQTQAAEEGVRGVALAPVRPNSRFLTFCQQQILYQENSFTPLLILLLSSRLLSFSRAFIPPPVAHSILHFLSWDHKPAGSPLIV